jgi:hypothetical protein
MTAKHVYQAINEVTAIMAREGLAKSRSNAQQGYKFRGIDDLYNAISVHLATAKLCILPRVVERTSLERQTKSGGVSTYTILTVEFDFVSAVDGSSHTIRTIGEAMDTADKSSNKAQSAAMKYCCLLAFQIPTEGENDADAFHPEPAPRRAGPVVSPADENAAVEVYVAGVDKAADLKALMSLYTALQADRTLTAAAKSYVVELCSAKRRQLESRAA